ncbi:MAG TPA: hypothetical protein VJK08_02010, partial [Patescibacteria group bacterium]|nr:hypothetical protein [Patescibacteria group bacterium]
SGKKKWKPIMPPGSALAVEGFTLKAAELMELEVECTIWDEHVLGLIQRDDMRDYDLCLITYLSPARFGAYRVAMVAKAAKVKTIAGGIDVTGMTRSLEGNTELLLHFDTVFVGHLTVASWRGVLTDWLADELQQVYHANEGELYEFVHVNLGSIDLTKYFIPGVQSSAGCLYGSCGGWCAVWLITGLTKVYCNDIGLLRKQLEELVAQGVTFFFDVSDCFGATPEDNPGFYTEQVLPLYREFYEKYDLTWGAEISVRYLGGDDGESGLMQQMHGSGCRFIYIGVESLKVGFAKNDPMLVKRVIERCRQLRIPILISFILDCDPEATAESVRADLKQLLRWGGQLFQLTLTVLVPGTSKRAQAIKKGRLLTYDPQTYDGLTATLEHAAKPEERARWLSDGWKQVYGLWNILRLLCWVSLHQPALLPIIWTAARRICTGARIWRANKLNRPSSDR